MFTIAAHDGATSDLVVGEKLRGRRAYANWSESAPVR
jgi:hypothetical protein